MTARASPSVVRVKTTCPDLGAYRDRYAPEFAQKGIFIPSKRPDARPIGTRVHLKIELADRTLGYSGSAIVVEHAQAGTRPGYRLHFDEVDVEVEVEVEVSIEVAPRPARPPPPVLARVAPPGRTIPVAAAPPAPEAPTRTPAPLGGAFVAPPPAPERVPASLGRGARAAAPARVLGRLAFVLADPAAGTPEAELPDLPERPGARELRDLPDLFGPAADASEVVDADLGPAATDAEDVAPEMILGPGDEPTPPPAAAEDVAAPADTAAPIPAAPVLDVEPLLAAIPAVTGEVAAAPAPAPAPAAAPARRGRRRILVAASAAVVACAAGAAALLGPSLRRSDPATETAFAAALATADDRIRAGRLATPAGDSAVDHLEAARRLLPADPRVGARAKLLADAFEALGHRALGRGDLQEARAHLEAAIRAEPARSSARAELETIAPAGRPGAPR